MLSGAAEEQRGLAVRVAVGSLLEDLTTPSGTTGYSYNPEGNLTGVTYPPGGLAYESFQYDLAGNRTASATEPAGSITYNANEQLIANPSATYTYDPAGNLLSQAAKSNGQATTYQWNPDHQLLAITPPGGTPITYGYDPLGRLVSASQGGSSTTSVYDANSVVASYQGGAASPTATFLSGIATNQQLPVAHYDIGTILQPGEVPWQRAWARLAVWTTRTCYVQHTRVGW